MDRIRRIRLLRGAHNREFVFSHALEPKYLGAAPQPLRDVAILILETGVRPGEAVGLQWPDVRLQQAVRAKHGYIVIRGGKSRNAKRNLRLAARAAEMLKARKAQQNQRGPFQAKPTGHRFLCHLSIISTMTCGRL